jgi:hypothetical protein
VQRSRWIWVHRLCFKRRAEGQGNIRESMNNVASVELPKIPNGLVCVSFVVR